MAQVLKEFAPFCRHVTDLKPKAIAAWIRAHPGRRPATVDSCLRSLRWACNHAVGEGYLKRSPFHVRSPREWVDWDVPELPPPVHSAEEIRRVLDRADSEALGGRWRACRLRAIVYTAAYTGARKREILGLKVSDLDLAGGIIRIATNARRGVKTRRSAAAIPVAPRLAEVLEEWIPMAESIWLFPGARRIGPWLDGYPGYRALDQMKDLGNKAGIPGFTFQSCRHSFATLSEQWGIGELALQRMLRHTSLKTQRGYRHEVAELLRDVASRVKF